VSSTKDFFNRIGHKLTSPVGPGRHTSGSAETFSLARACFEQAWSDLGPNIPASSFDDYRRDRTWRAELEAARACGELVPTQRPNSLMRCLSGITFDSHKPAESYGHRRHVYTAQAERQTW
jgi:hypothetical protein